MTPAASPLHVEVRGRGEPTLIFLHAFAASGAAWSGVIDRLEGDHRCAALDLRGFGRSPAAQTYSVASHADEVLAWAAAEVDGPFLLVGHSMGGKLALAAAARRPPGLVGLVLLAPSPPGPEPITEDERAARLAQHGDLDAARATLARITRAAVTRADADRFVADALSCSPSAWRWWLESGSRETLQETTPELAIPTLVLLGQADPVIPLDALTSVLSRPRSRLQRLAGTGHLIPLEQPGACAAAIRAAAF